MRLFTAGFAALLMICPASQKALRQDVVKSTESTQLTTVQDRYGLDPDVPLIGRLGEPPDSVLTIFREAGMSPKSYSPNTEDQQKILAALRILPPLHQKVLTQRLRTISLLSDMPNTALTSAVNSDEPDTLFDITIRAAILSQSAAEWIAGKESSCFNWKESAFTLRADVGEITAIQYVLLHEATHIVDATLEITPSLTRVPNGVLPDTATPFTRDVWDDARTPVIRYRDAGLMAIRFRPGGKVVDASTMRGLYEALARTPFVTLYGSSARTEDLAEFLTVYHLTQKLHQPFRITIHNGPEEVFAHSPMTSETVRSRFDLMRHFYEPEDGEPSASTEP
jgi:hypothetical protein